MDSLSALKMVMAPQAGGLAAIKSNAISPAELQQLGAPSSDTPLQPSAATGTNFENMLGGFVNDVAAQQAQAHSAVNGLLGGQNVSLHQAMISMEEANVSFQMMVEVRNRLMDGYQELMRMQI